MFLHLSHDSGDFHFFNFLIRFNHSDVPCSYFCLVFVLQILRDDDAGSHITSIAEREINNLFIDHVLDPDA